MMTRDEAFDVATQDGHYGCATIKSREFTEGLLGVTAACDRYRALNPDVAIETDDNRCDADKDDHG
jgi:hypothetical protein